MDKAQQVFTRHGDAIHGIFAVCEPNAMGVLEAMESAGLSGRVKFVAFDPADPVAYSTRCINVLVLWVVTCGEDAGGPPGRPGGGEDHLDRRVRGHA